MNSDETPNTKPGGSKKGKKTPYDPDRFPKLAEMFARDGLYDFQICEKLGIKKTAFYQYINLYPDFAEALKRGRVPVLADVESTLYKKSLGYDVEETSIEETKDKDGNVISKTVRTTIKHIQPDFRAMAYVLDNRTNGKWRSRFEHNLNPDDKPIKTENTQKTAFENMTEAEIIAEITRLNNFLSIGK